MEILLYFKMKSSSCTWHGQLVRRKKHVACMFIGQTGGGEEWVKRENGSR